MTAMLMIRLQRTGRKNEPTFRVVLTDSKNGPKSGKSLEILGSYDSRRAEQAIINFERIKHWMSHGAKTSGTVYNLLVSRKLISGKKVNVLPRKRPIKKEAKADTSAEISKDATTSTEAVVEVATPAPEATPAV